jgi:hypothetical protein
MAHAEVVDESLRLVREWVSSSGGGARAGAGVRERSARAKSRELVATCRTALEALLQVSVFVLLY